MIVSEFFNICFCRASVSLNSFIQKFLNKYPSLPKIIVSCFQYLFLRAMLKAKISVGAEKGVLQNRMLSCFSRIISTDQTDCQY
jgi:hypothetical protein